MRFARPLRWCLAISVLLAGCQSGAQSDLISRELRAQEDQIYAMEDYLAQYQQLICQVRAENAELKRQLAESSNDEALPSPASRAAPSGRSKSTPTQRPSSQTPTRPPANETESTELDVEIIEPEIPPLNDTSFVSPRMEVRGQSPDEPSAGEWRIVAPATEAPAEVNTTANDELAVAAAELPAVSNEPVTSIRIRGDVVTNETGGGPRLAVDVEPLSAALATTQFRGAVALMLLEPSGARPSNNLARWDYTSSEAAQAGAASRSGTMRFYLELPPDVPVDRPTEFWVRLMPDQGGKALESVRVDLDRPGRFDSMVGRAPTSAHEREETLTAESAAILVERGNIASVAATRLDDGRGWTIARPDRPWEGSDGDHQRAAAWRTASEPIPQLAESVPVPTKAHGPVHEVQQAAFFEPVAVLRQIRSPAPQVPIAPANIPRAPSWTPDRNGNVARVSTAPNAGPRTSAGPKRPRWSPVR